MNDNVRWALSQWTLPASARICLAFMMELPLGVQHDRLAFVKSCPVSKKNMPRVFRILEEQGYIRNIHKARFEHYFVVLKKGEQREEDTINPFWLRT